MEDFQMSLSAANITEEKREITDDKLGAFSRAVR